MKRHQLTSWVTIWTKYGLYHRVNQLTCHSMAQKQHFWRYSILLETLSSGFGVGGTDLKSFTSYLSQRTQQVQIKGTLSEKKQLTTGVPQGSWLGPVLFTIYVADLFHIIEKHLPEAQGYADDHQFYLSFRPIPSTNQTTSFTAVENCVAELRSWMISNMLMVNDSKTILDCRKLTAAQTRKHTIHSCGWGWDHTCSYDTL